MWNSEDKNEMGESVRLPKMRKDRKFKLGKQKDGEAGGIKTFGYVKLCHSQSYSTQPMFDP